VARVVAHCQQLGTPVPTSDTNDFCPARNKLSVAALREPSVEVAAELESQADPKWLWSGLRAKLVDDSKFTMPDTPASEARYRSPRS
jgi:hypothetical protein